MSSAISTSFYWALISILCPLISTVSTGYIHGGWVGGLSSNKLFVPLSETLPVSVSPPTHFVWQSPLSQQSSASVPLCSAHTEYHRDAVNISLTELISCPLPGTPCSFLYLSLQRPSSLHHLFHHLAVTSSGSGQELSDMRHQQHVVGLFCDAVIL